jgi:hypothetical protein
VHIFEHYDSREWTLPNLIKQRGEECSPLPIAAYELKERAPDLRRNVVERPKRARSKERFAGAPEVSGRAAMLADKLVYQRCFADASLSADQDCPPVAGRSHA